jgi:hypothetical protein
MEATPRKRTRYALQRQYQEGINPPFGSPSIQRLGPLSKSGACGLTGELKKAHGKNLSIHKANSLIKLTFY